MKVLIIVLFAAVVMSYAQAEHAADSIYDPEAMAEARAKLKATHGAQNSYFSQIERLEYQTNDGDPLVLWDAKAWFGSDLEKLWFKTEGAFDTDNTRFDEAEIQLLYSLAVHGFWDLQAGVRQDIKPDPSRTYAVLGLQGLAPYWFEIDTALFISNKGDVSLRLEAEYDFRLTQRVILQPRIEVNLAFSSDNDLKLGSGLRGLEGGMRLRYEISPQFAPYIGFSWHRLTGQTENLHQRANEDSEEIFRSSPDYGSGSDHLGPLK